MSQFLTLALVLLLALGVYLPKVRAQTTTFTVESADDNPDDTIDGTCADVNGMCTLRAAIMEHNAQGGESEIVFDVGTMGTNVISVGSSTDVTVEDQPLPAITADDLTIDGTTSGSIVVLDAVGTIDPNSNGLTIKSANNLIEGLVIIHFTGHGIEISGADASDNVIRGNFIGTDKSNQIGLGNDGSGILIADGAQDNQIGEVTSAGINVISGNGENGIEIAGDETSDNEVINNVVGTAADGNPVAGLGNGANGIYINDAPDNTIGGTDVSESNTISNNDENGLLISGDDADGNVIIGNFIGISISLNLAGNGENGVLIENGADDNIVGGAAAGAFNVIANNDGHGVRIDDSDSNGNRIEGNFIGVGQSLFSMLPRPNGGSGVLIDDASDNTIGGIGTARNIISANDENGVEIAGSGATGNVVAGNFIGVDVFGSSLTSVGNGANGVLLTGGAHDNRIGGTAAGEGNLIAHNGANGVHISGGATTDNLVQGNNIGIGVGLLATIPIPNGEDGVLIDGAAQNNIVGGSAVGAGNIISGNDGNGVHIGGEASGNVVAGNRIGTDSGGTVDVGNGAHGVLIDGTSSSNQIGVAAGNVIAFNTNDGVRVQDSGIENTITTNSIFANGGLGIDLLPLAGVTLNDIGDLDFGANNLQNFPVITSVTTDGTSTTIQGTLNSLPSTTFRIEFFANAALGIDPSGNGEGQSFIGFTNITTNASGNRSFSVTFSFNATGLRITSTATELTSLAESLGNTSEFSRLRLAVVVEEKPPDKEDDNTPIIPAAPSNTPTTVLSATPVPATVTPVPSNTPIPTNTPAPTNTPVPTSTPLPTSTPIPSATATTPPTVTPIPTRTATPVPSPTPLPPTATPVPSNTSIPSPTPVLATLVVTKEVIATDAYTIAIGNEGRGAADSVELSETFREGVYYVASSPGLPYCIQSGGRVDCDLGVLPPGAVQRVSLTVRSVGVDLLSGQTVVSAIGLPTVLIDDPYIIKSIEPAFVQPGGEITYVVRVINPTTDAATSVVVRDPVPADVQIVSAEATSGAVSVNGQTVVLQQATLEAGGRVTITIQGVVRGQTRAQEIVNRACLMTAELSSERCAAVSFIRVEGLPATGESIWVYGRWVVLALMLALAGLGVRLRCLSGRAA